MEGVMSHSDTLDLITERVIAAMELEEPMDRYPNRSCFVAADAPWHGETANEALAEGHPVVLVFPNGDEVVIEPGDNGTLPRVEVRDSAGQPLAA
jgi:hypothetical protein